MIRIKMHYIILYGIPILFIYIFINSFVNLKFSRLFECSKEICSTYNNIKFSKENNYILTKIYIDNKGSSYSDIKYFDGYGNIIQNNLINASPNGGDIIESFEYNNLGLLAKKYLPYVLNDNNGRFDEMYKKNQANYYINSVDKSIPNSKYPFKEYVYENNPLNKIKEISSEGKSWSLDSGHTRKFKYLFNTNKEVINFKIVNGKLVKKCFYKAGDLSVEQIFNENWKKEDGNINSVKIFKDYQGNKVLKRAYVLDNNGKEKFVSTYFVYDIYGDLIYILPPQMKVDYNDINNKILNEFAYFYKYDNQHRLIYKKIPGREYISLVYDKYNRLTLEQDGNQRKFDKWTYYKYDSSNRIKESGICITNKPIYQLKQYLFKYPNSIPWKHESYIVNYYDDYSFLKDSTFTFRDIRKKINYKTLNFNKNVKGLLTASKFKVLDSKNNKWIKTVYYYDSKYRLLEEIKNNYPQGEHIVLNEYDFVGNLVQLNILESNFNKSIQLTYKYSYDHRGRLVSQALSFNNNPFKLISKNKYDDLGIKCLKTLGEKNILEYSYNIRGWLRGIKSNVFDLSLFYEDYPKRNKEISYKNQYTRNISAVEWLYKQDGKCLDAKSYLYAYDDLSRLNYARYGQNDDFDSSFKYDLNGNIKSLKRFYNGDCIDDLKYKYLGNKLVSVADKTRSSKGFTDACNSSVEYLYDSNGNILSDKNKLINSISYNSINRPYIIDYKSSRVKFIYSIDGAKLQCIYPSKTITYSNGFIYENGKLSNVLIDNGRFIIKNDTTLYEYDICDHLGNVRAVVDDFGNLKQKNDYYPFGMLLSSSGDSDNNYLYNGNELLKKIGLLDYGARMYDASLAHFYTQDVFTENYFDLSSYQYVANNPILYVDINGDFIFIIDENGKRFKYDNGKLFYYLGKGKWELKKVLESSYLSQVLNALNLINSGADGRKLIEFFNDIHNNVFIRQTVEDDNVMKGNHYNGTYILTEKEPQGAYVPTQKGIKKSEFFVSLAHEMSHRKDDLRGTFSYKTWFSIDGISIIEAEKYSTHIENLIRAEHHLPLRTHYVSNGLYGLGPSIVKHGKSSYYKQENGKAYDYEKNVKEK